MATRFAGVGFPLYQRDDVDRFVQAAWQNGQHTSVDGGVVVRWGAGNGVELWEQTEPNGRVMGLDPHFSGRARMRIRLTHIVQQPGDGALEGCFYGWADPPENGAEEGAYPLVFRSPEFAFCRRLDLPAIREVQIAAFARQVSAYESDQTFDAAQATSGVRWSPESFVPTGLFPTESDTEAPFRPLAYCNGRILHTSDVTNPSTGLQFNWAHIQTAGGELDVVADPETLKGKSIVGGVISGSFWLSGRIITVHDDWSA